jgi:hypothetical protein
MARVGLTYHPKGMGIKREELTLSLLNLKNYVNEKPSLWYTVIDDSEITREWALKAMTGLKF